MPKVFISYARSDCEEKATQLRLELEGLGIEVWQDQEKMRGGTDFRQQINAGLRDAQAVLVLLSPGAVASNEVKTEWKLALALNKSVIPIKVLTCRMPSALRHLHCRDLSRAEKYTAEFNNLVNDLNDVLTHVNQRTSSLTSTGFAYPPPDWLTNAQREELSNLAKAAFLLLLFEQTDTGCWSKSYLPRQKEENPPDSHGALTGTPFALIAASSYAESQGGEGPGKTELFMRASTYRPLFITLVDLLQPDGTYRKYERIGYPGKEREPEKARHAAGACLIKLLYERFVGDDKKTLEWLCTQPLKMTYDLAVVSRLFLQVPNMNSIPPSLLQKVYQRREELLAELVLQIESVPRADIARESEEMSHDCLNQWSTAWYILALLNVSTPTVRVSLINRLRHFLLAQSAGEPTGTNLLPAEVDRLGSGDVGKTVFGTGVALLSWRTLERINPEDPTSSLQAQRMLNRIINSVADAIEAPIFNPDPKTREGYLGWGAICLCAASLGIRISYEDCRAAVELIQKLSKVAVNSRTPAEVENAYRDEIDRSRLVTSDKVDYVARAMARVATIYEPFKRVRAEG